MAYQDRIFFQATAGTAKNPKGLPPVLASLLVAQAAHETGNFTSNLFRSFNNAFGYMYVPGALYQVGAGSLADNGQPIAKYNSIEDSTKEVIDWIYRRVADGKFPKDLTTITNPNQYAELLKNAGYYGDTVSNYAAGLRKFFANVVQELEKPPVKIFTLVALGLAFYWLYKRKK